MKKITIILNDGRTFKEKNVIWYSHKIEENVVVGETSTKTSKYNNHIPCLFEYPDVKEVKEEIK